MSWFSVATGDLRRASNGLAGLLDDLDSVGGQVGNADPGCAGHPALEGAISSFASVWSPAVGQLREALYTTSQNLGAGAEVYDAADSAIRAAFER